MKLERFDYVTPESGTRTTRFDIVLPNGDGQYACNICTVFQFSSIKDFTLQAPSVGWSSWQSQTDLTVINLIADTFRQAADLLTEWAADKGVPPAGNVTRFQPLRGIARFYYARPFEFLRRGVW